MKNAHISLAEFALRMEAKILSGLMVFSIVISQTMLPLTSLAAFDLSGYTGTPLETANATMESTFNSIKVVSEKVATLNKQLSGARAGVLTLAMDQGIEAQSDMLKQITDASKILPDDAIRLATTMVDQGIAAGALTMQAKDGATLGMATAEEMVDRVFRDYWGVGAYGVDVVDQIIWGQPYCYDDDANIETPDFCIDKTLLQSWINLGTSALLAYPSPITQATAELVLNSVYVVPSECHYESDNEVCTPGSTIVVIYHPEKLGTSIRNNVIRNLAGQLVSSVGILDEAGVAGGVAYKKVFADQIVALTGVGSASALSAALGVPTFETFTSVVKNAIHADILKQVKSITDEIISPSAISAAVYGVIGDPKNTMEFAAQKAIDAALAGSGVSLTQLTNLKNIDADNVKNIIIGALNDNGLLGSVTPAQLNKVFSGSFSDFRAYAGTASIDSMKGLVAEQLSLAGLGSASTLLSKMNVNTLTGLQNTIKDEMLKNAMSQMTGLTGSLNPDLIQSTIAKSILGTTGIGDLTKITGLMTKIPDFGGTLTSLQANIPIMSLSTSAITDAISGKAVSLTQLTNIGAVGTLDIESMINGALLDNGLFGAVSTADYEKIVSGLTEKFLTVPDGILDVHGVANLADIKGLVGGEIGSVLGMDSASIISGMGGETLSSIQGSIENVMMGNVTSQLTSLGGALNIDAAQGLISNSILGTTGLGNYADLTKIMDGIPNMDIAMSSIQGSIQGVIDGQMLKLTDGALGYLNPDNVSNLIAGKLNELTGLSDVSSILGKINPNIGTAFSTITQVGGQLESITGQFTGAFDGSMLGLNSLTNTFNGYFGDLTTLAQQNLAGITSQLSSIAGPLMSQISGPISSAIGSLSGTAGGIIGSGAASLGDLSSLTGSLGGVTGSLTGALSGSTGVTSMTGIGGVTSASGMVQNPLGGPNMMSIPCTAGDIPGSWLLRSVNYAGGAGDLIYIPGRSVLYPNFQVYRGGAMLLGLYSSATVASCWVGAGIFRFMVGAGPVISMVGTSI